MPSVFPHALCIHAHPPPHMNTHTDLYTVDTQTDTDTKTHTDTYTDRQTETRITHTLIPTPRLGFWRSGVRSVILRL